MIFVLINETAFLHANSQCKLNTLDVTVMLDTVLVALAHEGKRRTGEDAEKGNKNDEGIGTDSVHGRLQ